MKLEIAKLILPFKSEGNLGLLLTNEKLNIARFIYHSYRPKDELIIYLLDRKKIFYIETTNIPRLCMPIDGIKRETISTREDSKCARLFNYYASLLLKHKLW